MTELVSVSVRESAGWRAGKPIEDPEKMKRWGRISARPSEYLIHMRRGNVLSRTSGQGASCFKLPWDSVAIVPTTVQELKFVASQITSEKVGVEVTGHAVYRIADPLIAFRMLNFSFSERASEKLASLLNEMFVGAARRLVANLTLDECLSRRKEGIAEELMREIAPVVSGRGRIDDDTDRGWGVVIDTIEIQDVRVTSSSVFSNLQATYRQEQERRAREAALATERALDEARLEAERSIAERRFRAEIDAVRFEAEARAARHEAARAAFDQEMEVHSAQAQLAEARRLVAEAELAVAQIELKKIEARQEVELAHERARKAIENTVSQEVIQLTVANQLPLLAAAFQQKMGEVHVTAVDGANPFGYIASAVEGVMGLARAAGLQAPKKD